MKALNYGRIANKWPFGMFMAYCRRMAALYVDGVLYESRLKLKIFNLARFWASCYLELLKFYLVFCLIPQAVLAYFYGSGMYLVTLNTIVLVPLGVGLAMLIMPAFPLFVLTAPMKSDSRDDLSAVMGEILAWGIGAAVAVFVIIRVLKFMYPPEESSPYDWGDCYNRRPVFRRILKWAFERIYGLGNTIYGKIAYFVPEKLAEVVKFPLRIWLNVLPVLPFVGYVIYAFTVDTEYKPLGFMIIGLLFLPAILAAILFVVPACLVSWSLFYWIPVQLGVPGLYVNAFFLWVVFALFLYLFLTGALARKLRC